VYIWGNLFPGGEIELGTVYKQAVSAPPPTAGDYLVEVLGNDGEILASYPFAMAEVSDAPGFFHFGFFLPDTPGLTGLRLLKDGRILTEKFIPDELISEIQEDQTLRVESRAEGTLLEWPVVRHPGETVRYRLRLSHDGGTSWQVLALDVREPRFSLPAEVLAAIPNLALLEVQASDGIHTSTRIFEIKKP
jgi:hypothetical protein